MMNAHATYVCLILLICSACSFLGRPDNPLPRRNEASATHKVDGTPNRDPLTTKFFEGNRKGAAAWREFVKDGRYRLADEQDFRFSTQAQKYLKSVFGEEWRSRAFNPYTGGEINHDKYYRDIAFIVVDNARNDLNRFGLVILNEQPNDAAHNLYWLYRERDLSTTVFGWASDGLRLHEFDQEGEPGICRVSWNNLRQEYRCR